VIADGGPHAHARKANWRGRRAIVARPRRPARDRWARKTPGRALAAGRRPRLRASQPSPGETERPILGVRAGVETRARPETAIRPSDGETKVGVSRPISRVLSGGLLRDGHSSGAPLARRLEQPTRAAAGIGPGTLGPTRTSRAAPIRSCSRWGLPCRLRCRRRGALLPHRFTLAVAGCPARAVSSLWHFPWGHPRRPLAATANPWSPDFPPPRAYGRKAGSRGSGRPAG
jgi:hypothetical protein